MAKVLEARAVYSAHSDVLTVLREPAPDYYAIPTGDPLVAVLFGEGTREIVGVEVVGFLEPEASEAVDGLPYVNVLWRLPGGEPLPLRDLLEGQRRELTTASNRGAPGAA